MRSKIADLTGLPLPIASIAKNLAQDAPLQILTFEPRCDDIDKMSNDSAVVFCTRESLTMFLKLPNGALVRDYIPVSIVDKQISHYRYREDRLIESLTDLEKQALHKYVDERFILHANNVQIALLDSQYGGDNEWAIFRGFTSARVLKDLNETYLQTQNLSSQQFKEAYDSILKDMRANSGYYRFERPGDKFEYFNGLLKILCRLSYLAEQPEKVKGYTVNLSTKKYANLDLFRATEHEAIQGVEKVIEDAPSLSSYRSLPRVSPVSLFPRAQETTSNAHSPSPTL